MKWPSKTAPGGGATTPWLHYGSFLRGVFERHLGGKMRQTTRYLVCLILASICGLALVDVRTRQSSPSLVIHFSGFTEHETNRCAAFDITNRSSDHLDFLVAVERAGANRWPDYGYGSDLPHRPPQRVDQEPSLAPYGSYSLLVIPPSDADSVSWRVSVGYQRPRRARVYDPALRLFSLLCGRVGLAKAAYMVHPSGELVFESGPIMSPRSELLSKPTGKISPKPSTFSHDIHFDHRRLRLHSSAGRRPPGLTAVARSR